LPGEVIVVHLRGLPPGEPGCSVLRLMATPRSAAEASAGVDALLSDPGVINSTKETILEKLMSEAIPSTAEERESILTKTRREARAAGLAEGRAEGRAVLLKIARVRLGDTAAEELSGIEDLAELEQRLLALLTRQ